AAGVRAEIRGGLSGQPAADHDHALLRRYLPERQRRLSEDDRILPRGGGGETQRGPGALDRNRSDQPDGRPPARGDDLVRGALSAQGRPGPHPGDRLRAHTVRRGALSGQCGDRRDRTPRERGGAEGQRGAGEVPRGRAGGADGRRPRWRLDLAGSRLPRGARQPHGTRAAAHRGGKEPVQDRPRSGFHSTLQGVRGPGGAPPRGAPSAARGARRRGRSYEEELHFDDGQVVRLFGSAVPLRQPDGVPRGAIAAFVDVTRLKQAEAALREADRRKDEFVALLSHELRNPLAPILSAVELMQLQGDVATPREREVILRQAQHLLRLVDDLLDVSRIARGKVTLARRRIELGGVVAKAAEATASLLEERHHRLRVSAPAKGLAVDADEVRLTQVVSNLLTNAAHYTARLRSLAGRARPGPLAGAHADRAPRRHRRCAQRRPGPREHLHRSL